MNIDEAIRIIKDSSNIVFLTGAGFSLESEIPTFRGAEGIWEEFQDGFSTWSDILNTLHSRPDAFLSFLVSFLKPIVFAKPNHGHKLISLLQNKRNINVITQNVDGLHSQAGTLSVIELHGTVYEVIDDKGNVRNISKELLENIIINLESYKGNPVSTNEILSAIKPIFAINTCGITRPNLVMFGDVLDVKKWNQAINLCADCECIVVVGTSRTVYPAASLVDVAVEHGAQLIVINPNASEGNSNIRLNASEALEIIANQIDN